MARLTPALAAKHLRYIEREESLGRMTDILAGIREHRLALLKRSRACFHCGELIRNKESLKQWEVDRLGPVCRERLSSQAVAS